MGQNDIEHVEIDGHNVQFEHWMMDWAIKYMRGLDAAGRHALFQGAKDHGDNGQSFRVSHGGPHMDFTLWEHNNNYEIKKKKQAGGWF